MNTLQYKGYLATIEYDADSATLFGKIEGISDLVTFESKNADAIVDEFHSAVDDYLEFCADVGKTPDVNVAHQPPEVPIRRLRRSDLFAVHTSPPISPRTEIKKPPLKDGLV